MTDTLRLSAFALPPTFPPESVPDACTRFVPGLTKRQLLARTRARGWAPVWRPLTHLVREGFEAVAFDLIVDGARPPLPGCSVSGRMSTASRYPRQLPLF
ncbi:hypothetical protein D1006_40260 [Burkholderia stabilis]|uniref:Uncharacterized protein n=1 Tax=Burkholderia stabilis TaxID=95485 RepID=A0A4Q2A5W0_9BURK|nr:hypothetical protein D1006_40260 [Burkholderia stabilis]